jgi:O-antigen/teichoic acid export membrane protein
VRNLIAGVAATSIARIYLLAVGLVSVTLSARWLGPTGQGIVAAATAWAAVFANLGGLSLGQVAMHRATERRREQWVGETFGTLITLAMVITLGCWTVAAVMYAATDGSVFSNLAPQTLLITFLLVPFLIWEQYGSSLLVAVDRVAVYYRAQLIARTFAVLLMLIAWRLHLPVVIAIVIAVISQILVAILGMRQLARYADEKIQPSRVAAAQLIVGGLKLHLTQFGAFIFGSLAVLMISHYSGPAQTGLYQFAMSMINVMYVVPITAGTLLSARVAKQGADDAWQQQKKFVLLLPAVMGALAIMASAVAPFAIRIVAGAQFAGAVPIFRLLLFSVVGVTFATVMGPQWIGRGLFWQMSAMSLFAAAVYAGLCFLWIPRYGMDGAAYATIVLSALMIVGNGTLAFHCETRLRSRSV